MKKQRVTTFLCNLSYYRYIQEVNLEYFKNLSKMDNNKTYAADIRCIAGVNNGRLKTPITDLFSK